LTLSQALTETYKDTAAARRVQRKAPTIAIGGRPKKKDVKEQVFEKYFIIVSPKYFVSSRVSGFELSKNL